MIERNAMRGIFSKGSGKEGLYGRKNKWKKEKEVEPQKDSFWCGDNFNISIGQFSKKIFNYAQ